MTVTDAALRTVISEYTREAGVRNLERQLGTIARKVAARLATRPADAPPARPTVVDSADVDDYLGPARFKKEVAFRTSMPGVVTGVAWTEVGGDVLFVEVTLLPGGNQNIILTGQLGNVMQESARAALSHIRSRAEALGISPEFLAKHDLHIHVPAGAIPKDGPSAGITIATAILSAARHQPVKPGVAMTGEITLSGLVLPVGGIREKALAARRFGVRTFVSAGAQRTGLVGTARGTPARHDLRAGRDPRAGGEGRIRREGLLKLAQAIVFYISGHGFGHASRSIEVINAILAKRPEVRVGVRTSAPRWLFDLSVKGKVAYSTLECDTGVVQVDGLTLDEADSIRRAASFHSDLVTRAASETRVAARARRRPDRRRHPAAGLRGGRVGRHPVRSRSATSPGTGSTPTTRACGSRRRSCRHPRRLRQGVDGAEAADGARLRQLRERQGHPVHRPARHAHAGGSLQDPQDSRPTSRSCSPRSAATGCPASTPPTCRSSRSTRW